MNRISHVFIVTATILVMISICSIAVDTTAATAQEHSGGHAGSRSLGVEVTSGGDTLDNVPVKVVNWKTENQVFSGYTDSAGQVNVTLPQGQYDVVVQNQKYKNVNLNKDQNVSFNLNSDERPKE